MSVHLLFNDNYNDHHHNGACGRVFVGNNLRNIPVDHVYKLSTTRRDSFKPPHQIADSKCSSQVAICLLGILDIHRHTSKAPPRSSVGNA